MLDLEAAQDPYLEEYKSARDKLRTAEMPQALDKLNDLANRGSVMSLLLIADALRVGRLYNQDLVGAAEWYRVAVEAGWPRAHYGLAQTFHRMKRDDDAIKLFEQACAMEYGPAFNFLGILYWHGRGVPVDRHKALALFRRGAAFGHIPSKVNLARALLKGGGGLLGRVRGFCLSFPVAYKKFQMEKGDTDTDRLRE